MKFKFREDTPYRLIVGFFISCLIYLLGFGYYNVLLFLTAFFWTQSWNYGNAYREKKFRPSVFRIILELYWMTESLREAKPVYRGKWFQLAFYIPPLAFCYLLIFISANGSILIPVIGTFFGGVLNNYLESNNIGRESLASYKTNLDSESEELLNESSQTAQSHQKDSEKDL